MYSVVIPTYNRLPMLLRVLEALDRQVDAPEFEVVVVNDGSKDATAETLARLELESGFCYPLIQRTQKNAGPGRARNFGVELSSGEFVVFIGDDTVPERRFLAEHHRVHAMHDDDPWVACLGYTGWPAEEPVTAFMDYINDYGLQFGYKLIEHDTIVPFNFFYTSNISISREVLIAHPFDTSFPAAAWEDIELAYRLDQLGLEIHYNADAVTRHHHPTTVASFARRQYTVGRSGAIFLQMHPELRHFLGVEELREKGAGTNGRIAWLTLVAKAGETFRMLARPKAFEQLMRLHYLRGLSAGIEEHGDPLEKSG
ncbi:MAG: glycosyltransferase family 2 protein [Thermoanaerobaculia bacterium]|nr:glycosyltransferase family 2 protein [Thermoanaerobaculia bacterium]